MAEGSVTVESVEVLRVDGSAVLECRAGDRHFYVPSYNLLAGTQARYPGQRGVMVLPEWFAQALGLSTAR